MGPRISLDISKKRKKSLALSGNRKILLAHGTITILTELYGLPSFHDAEISSKGGSYSTSERDLRFQGTENSLPSLSTPSIGFCKL
jgi:hypothetical protein